jgi:hypothetical protein
MRNIETQRVDIDRKTISIIGLSQAQRLKVPPIKFHARPFWKHGFPLILWGCEAPKGLKRRNPGVVCHVGISLSDSGMEGRNNR